MVWGCCAAIGVGNIVFIDSKVNADVYIKILRDNLHVSAEQLGTRETFKMYQDNERP